MKNCNLIDLIEKEAYFGTAILATNILLIGKKNSAEDYRVLNQKVENAFLKYYELEAKYYMLMEGMDFEVRDELSDLLNEYNRELDNIERIYAEMQNDHEEYICKKSQITEEDKKLKQVFDDYYLESSQRIGQYELNISPCLRMWYEDHNNKGVVRKYPYQEN